jgi:hypothetical protein
MNDLHVLDIETLLWKEIKQLGDIPNKRSGCRLTYWNNNLIVLGGGLF